MCESQRCRYEGLVLEYTKSDICALRVKGGRYAQGLGVSGKHSVLKARELIQLWAR